MTWIKNSSWKNGKSYITIDELFETYVEAINKIGAILYDETYFEDTQIFARSILEFAIDHEYITWKQYYALMKIETTAVRLKKYHHASSYCKNKLQIYPSARFIYRNSETTDQEFDKLSEKLFWHSFHQEEFDGYVKSYRSDGSRYWSLPTEKDLQLVNYV